ncbi:YihY/virulence factor BrkB family protein [Microbacterium sp. KSW2-21]|uniref:YihY/virulence factor BrkB family protein n=1 Tax=Microbacterium algihabitans TaxID=3075992 RepID=A0ABU3S097_9MICO|nr:YihY/virulence factor BrkB family protein [Microbacterium sp. KSW2-21]MDU0328547.1 YihY/virulence factor BrkB family protein [Microbacterium sp. KSW2-21]
MTRRNTDEATRTGTATPDPEADAKPDSPTDLKKRSWKYVLRKTVREFTADQCMDAAAGLVYYAVLALFPALLAIFSILGVVGQGAAAADAILGVLRQVAPDAASTLQDPIQQIARSPAAGFALISGIVLALWSASGYVGAFSRAMNRIYEIDEGRPFWKLRPMQLVVTVIAVVALVLVALGLVVSGDVTVAIGNALGLGPGVQLAWDIAKWPVMLLVVVFLVAMLYYATPNAKQPKFRWISIGAVIAIVVLGAATAGFGFYVANFSNYDRTYGSLAGVIIFLLWLWIANLALLFGAEFDAELERGRQLQAGIAAEEDIQLPARDTRKSDKAEEKEREDVREGRRIRRSESPESYSMTPAPQPQRRRKWWYLRRK